MELTKDAKINSFLLNVEFKFSTITKLERFEMGSVFDKATMRTGIGGLFTAYIAIAFNLLGYIDRDTLNSFLDDISEYADYTVDQLFDLYDLEKLENDYSRFIKIIDNLRG